MEALFEGLVVKAMPTRLRPNAYEAMADLWAMTAEGQTATSKDGRRDVVPEFCRRLSPAGGFWRKFLIPAPTPSPAARSRIPGGIPSGLQELQEWRSSCY
ncbi:hypothetical protein RhiJN_10507 [Ceratobasidium sp. AG-Ba]|nr:hypothetical protein RhiJN_10507 [Ceratobasidium sp. AG-Ba]QRW11240.1 hypothetical protein RhiLY_10239 [Ceratobasidium sp. AG-Ba]